MTDALPLPVLKPWPQVLAGGVAAVLTGGLLAAFELIMFQILLYVMNAQPHLDIDMPGMWPVFLTSVAVFSVAFAVGALVLATPCWIVLHRMGLRQKGVAMAMGAILAGGASAVMPLLVLGPAGLVVAVPGGLAVAAAGAASGWVAHRLAYGRTERWFEGDFN